MHSRSLITSSAYADITSVIRDLAHATIEPMPRRPQTRTDTEATRALDAAVREYDEVEELLRRKNAQLRAAIIEAAKEAAQPDSHLTITEIAERVGWKRETISRIASGAGVKQREPKLKKA